MKQGDFGIKLFFTILDENNTPLTLTGATSVMLYMVMASDLDDIIEGACTVEDEDKGLVSYIIQEGDLKTDGYLYMEVEVNFEGQKFISATIKDVVEKRIKQPGGK
jgi:hypothetical protein